MKQRAFRDWQPVPTLLLGLILFVVALIIAVWWWSGTQASLQWALQRAARTQPIAVQDAHGSLRGGATIARVAWERDGLKVEAEEVVFAWRPVFLLGGTLKLDQVHARLVRITDRRPPSSEPPKLPLSLAIPVQVDLDDLAVSRIEWVTGHAMSGENLAGRYWFDGKAHWLRVDRLHWAGASYRGQASVGAAAPMPLDATLSGELAAPVPGANKVPVQFTATVQGPVADMTARAHVVATPGAAGSQVTQATATARITPWAAQPVPEAQASLNGLDLSSVWTEAPRTALAGEVRVTPAGTATWQVTADLRNTDTGPWDAGRLPVESLRAQGQWQSGIALVKTLEARLGGGSLHANGRWQPPAKGGTRGGWIVHGNVAGVDPASLHTRLDALPLGGDFDVRQEESGIAFEADLQGSARVAPLRAAAKGKPAPIALQRLKAQGRWADGLLSLPAVEARTSDASVIGALELRPADRAGSGKLALQAPGMRGTVDGSLSQAQGAGSLRLQAGDLAQARSWLARLPGIEVADRIPPVAGRADLAVTWQGGWSDPRLEASLASQRLELQSTTAPVTAIASTTATSTATTAAAQPVDNVPAAAAKISVTDLIATFNGRLSNAAIALRATARQGDRVFTLDTSGRGGGVIGKTFDWRATLAALSLGVKEGASAPGMWRLALQGPVEARGSGPDLEVGAGRALLTAPAVAGKATTPATLTWDPLRKRAGELRTAGRVRGLPMAWLELLSPQLAGSALAGDMMFDAQWDAVLGKTLQLDASLARVTGDVTVLAESDAGAAQRVAAGVRDARLTLASRGEQVTATLTWNSERAGTAEGRVVTRLAPGGALGWQWPQDAPIDGSLRAHLPRIGVWSLLAPPGWRLRGSLDADIRAGGTRAAPQLAGTLGADDLALRSVVDGIELSNGRLRAQLEANRLRITEFTLHGAGERGAGGTLTASGDVAWANGAPQLRAVAEIARLRASIRSDRELTVSGRVEASMEGGATTIRGKLKVDQARIVLPEETAPRLGDDVVVRNSPEFEGTVKERKAEKADERAPRRPLAVAVDLDLGEDFQVSGRGLRTRVAGTLALSAESVTQPRLAGTIRTRGGEYRAYGQRLDIERGEMRFNGPIANPGLDILAVRPNLTQRVGVLITGNAQAPFVRLYAEPDLPDAEKLAWLVTGRAAPATGAEAALVQQAALVLLANRRPGSQSIASRVGLDELSVRRDTSAGAVVTLGKRFADNFYASYERSLSGALGTLFVFYDVSQKLTVRAQAGERAGVDLIYTFRFN